MYEQDRRGKRRHADTTSQQPAAVGKRTRHNPGPAGPSNQRTASSLAEMPTGSNPQLAIPAASLHEALPEGEDRAAGDVEAEAAAVQNPPEAAAATSKTADLPLPFSLLPQKVKSAVPPPPAPKDAYMRFYSYFVGGAANVASSACWKVVANIPALQPSFQAAASGIKNLFGGVSDRMQGNKFRGNSQLISAASQTINIAALAATETNPASPVPLAVRSAALGGYAAGQFGIGHADFTETKIPERGRSYQLSGIMNLAGSVGFAGGAAVVAHQGEHPTGVLAQAMLALQQVSNFSNAVTSFGGMAGHYMKDVRSGGGKFKTLYTNKKVLGQAVTGIGYAISGAATTALHYLDKSDPAQFHQQAAVLSQLGITGMSLVAFGQQITAGGEVYKAKSKAKGEDKDKGKDTDTTPALPPTTTSPPPSPTMRGALPPDTEHEHHEQEHEEHEEHEEHAPPSPSASHHTREPSIRSTGSSVVAPDPELYEMAALAAQLEAQLGAEVASLATDAASIRGASTSEPAPEQE